MLKKNVPSKIAIPVDLVLYGLGWILGKSLGSILELVGALMFLFGLGNFISDELKAAYGRIKNKQPKR